MSPVEAAADHLDERLQVERLEDGLADAVRRDLLDSALAGSSKDNDVREPAGLGCVVEPLEKVVAVDLRHHQIEQDEVEAGPANLLQSCFPVFRHRDLEVHSRENSFEENADGHVIVDDEDLLRAGHSGIVW